MNFSMMLFFSIAVSLDGLGAGIAYGLKKIRIPVMSLLIIGFITLTALLISMVAAKWISLYIAPRIATALGGTILIGLGAWSILQECLKQCLPEQDTEERKIAKQLNCDAEAFRLVMKVFNRPTEADVDRSGVLNIGEAFILGIALALDALVAGFSAALSGGITVWAAITVAIVQMLFITVGAKVAAETCSSEMQKNFIYLPGGIFILIGLLRFW